MKATLVWIRILIGLSILWSFATSVGHDIDMIIPVAVTAILIVIYLGLEVIRHYRESIQKESEAYSLGYRAMNARLHAPYAGPDPGYDNVLVAKSYLELMERFTGEDADQRSYIRGMQDAITTYEREHGAP